jgi:biopolymer transport protein ExbB
MDGLTEFLQRSDAVGRAVTVLLLLMSVSAWVVILWKTTVLRRVRQDLGRAVPAFWAAPNWSAAEERLASLDRERILWPLVQAARSQAMADTLEGQSQRPSQLTRHLRDALQRSVMTLQFGQVLLASIGSTAPFVGLFGTVWGIYHALMGIGSAGQFTLDKVAGPVGEALIMTAAGLAVAIPAVLAYNLFGKWVSACEAALEGFAHDLRELALTHPEAWAAGPH